jgi:hypothetical protein
MANLNISEEALKHLKEMSIEGWKVSSMPVQNISADISERVTEQSEEISYVFLHKEGNILFRNINGIHQVSSCTAKNATPLLQKFCAICDAEDIPYTAIGFEPA